MNLKIRESFGDWAKRHIDADTTDFSELGLTVLANVKLTPDNGGEPVEYIQPTQFQVTSNSDGTVYKLKEISNTGKNYMSRPYSNKTYTLTKSEYEKLLLFPSQPQQPAM